MIVATMTGTAITGLIDMAVNMAQTIVMIGIIETIPIIEQKREGIDIGVAEAQGLIMLEIDKL